jgi:hypothetical protein
MPHTLDQLEAFVSSPHYDSVTAGLIASGIPTLKAADGELISPGVRRIHGNLCNVHGRYGPCDAAGGKKKPAKGRKPAKPKQTPAQRAEARTAQRQTNIDNVAKQMADNDTGLSPSGSKALTAFAQGKQPDAAMGKQLAQMGLAEQASDGSFRMTPTGRGVVSAMAAGDYQRAVDGISRGGDTSAKRQERTSAAQTRQAGAAKRQQDAAGKRLANQLGRELAKRQPKPAKAASGGSKKPAAHEQAPEKPRAPAKPKRAARQSAPSVGSVNSGSSAKPKPAAPKPAPAKQIAPALQTAADQLSQGAELSDDDTQALIRNGLAKLNKDGALVLTAAGMHATQKAFRVFKDAQGRARWVAQSSTAFQDRDREIVSTKALADDCAHADESGSYGPLRWWHTPGLDLGDCDFNAMHGRVLIESGTFRSPAIAQKVAQAAGGLEISLGFLHLPNEPDADGVFHQVAALKTLGFSDDDITGLQAQATATEKAATDQGVAFKAGEPAELPDVIINGVTYKAFPPKKDDEVVVEAKAPLPGNPEEDALDGGVDDAMEEEVAPDENALTLSTGDLAAISEAIQSAVATIMGGLDLEKKVASHVQGFLAPMAQAQTTKDAEAAQQRETIAQLQQQLKELTGDQPATSYRASQARDNVLTDATMLAAAKQLNDPNASDPWADIKLGLGLTQH